MAFVGVLCVLTATGSSVTLANDTLEVTVQDFVGPVPSQVNPAAGTFRDSGQVMIRYIVNAPAFSTNNNFAQFTLRLRTNDSPNSNNEPSYPVNIGIAANGNDAGQNVLLVPTTSPLALSGLGAENSTTVTVRIDCTNTACPTNNGDEIDRHLQFTSSNNRVGTSVQVHVIIQLVIPEEVQCLAVANVVTDQGWTQQVNSTEVVVIDKGKNANTVRATTPFGQLSQDIAVVNSADCFGTEHFDLLITLDPVFETNPNNNPGNAVFLYYSDEEIDLAGFVPDVSGYSLPQGQTLCLSDLWLDPGQSLVATVHMQIQRGIYATSLPWPEGFVFSTALHEPDAGACATGSVLLEADDWTVNYTIK